MSNEKDEKSFYNGDALTNVIFTILFSILRIISLDLATPIITCLRLRWRAEHTYINGKRLVFCGQISDILKKNTLWVFLSIITFGVFIPFKAVKMMKWEIEHTHFVGVPKENYEIEKSEFKCSWCKYAGVNILEFLVTVFSFGIAYFWAYTFKERVLARHKFIDGHNLEFNATGGKFFLKKILWSFLSIITLGIYGLFLKSKMFRWQIANTSVSSPQSIVFSSEVAEKQPVQPINKKAYISFFLLFPNFLFLICSWLSRVLCSHGIKNVIIIVPYIFAVLSIFMALTLFLVSYKSYKISLQIKSGKYLTIALCIIDILLILVGFILLIYLVILTV